MLDARQLDALAAVIEHGSFGAAAKALSLTLAAVSLRIKSLEAELGQRLLVRGKQVRATPAGQALLGHVKQVRLMESDLMAGLPGGAAGTQTLSVAVNADSLTSWFLPGVAGALQAHRLLLDVVVDDQDHTHDALKSGDVVGGVTTLAQSLRGCAAEPLGVMRYRCVAAPALIAEWGGGAAAQFAAQPGSHLQPQGRLAGCLSCSAFQFARCALPAPLRASGRRVRVGAGAGTGLGHGARHAAHGAPRRVAAAGSTAWPPGRCSAGSTGRANRWRRNA